MSKVNFGNSNSKQARPLPSIKDVDNVGGLGFGASSIPSTKVLSREDPGGGCCCCCCCCCGGASDLEK